MGVFKWELQNMQPLSPKALQATFKCGPLEIALAVVHLHKMSKAVKSRVFALGSLFWRSQYEEFLKIAQDRS